MLSRALSLATAMLLFGFAAPSTLIATAEAQNLEAGKSPAQLFNANCSVCHKSARGLLRTVAPGQLSGFLRQHYTTSSDMAQVMSAYVAGNGGGAAGGRKPNDDGLTKQGRELSREQQPAPADAAPAADRRLRPAAAEPAVGPDGMPEPAHSKRRSKRKPPAEAAPDAARPGDAPVAEEPAAPKSNTGKKGRRLAPKTEVAPKSDARPETDKVEPPKEAAPAKPVEKPVEESKPEAKPETPPATRSDPVPQVTPAPKADAPEAPAAPSSGSDAK